MRKIIAYIAQSLDGKIADQNGGVDWLDQIPKPEKTDYGYMEFYQSIDTTIMGNKTYQQVKGFGIPFPYSDKKNYVLTNNQEAKNDEHVEFISTNIPEFFKQLKKEEGKNIWLIGGGKVNSFFLSHQLIDEMLIFTMPVILGEGLPLFSGTCPQTMLQLQHSTDYSSGAMLLHYLVEK